MRVVTLVVFGTPEPKGSAKAFVRRINGQLRAIVTSDNPSVAKWEGLIRFEANRVVRSDPRLFDGPVSLSVEFHLPRPASISKKSRPLPTVKPDLDKLVRAVGDALTSVIWKDDGSIVAISATKVYTDGPAKAVITVSDYLPGGINA